MNFAGNREIGRIVVIAMDEHNPVIGFPKTPCNHVIDRLIIPRLLESEATIPGHDEKGILRAVLEAQLEYNTPEVPMYISGDNDLLGIRIFENLCH